MFRKLRTLLFLIGCVLIAGATMAITKADLAVLERQMLAILGAVLALGNSQLNTVFIARIIPFWEKLAHKPQPSPLPFGNGGQIAFIGCILVGVVAVTYTQAEIPQHLTWVPIILGVQAAMGCIMIFRGACTKRVYYRAEWAFDAELCCFLAGNALMCYHALRELGPNPTMYHPAIATQMLWIALGLMHHFWPFKAWFLKRGPKLKK